MMRFEAEALDKHLDEGGQMPKVGKDWTVYHLDSLEEIKEVGLLEEVRAAASYGPCCPRVPVAILVPEPG